MTSRRFAFEFAPAYRLPALLFAVTPATAWVDLSATELAVRFGPWSLRTALENVDSAEISGGYRFVKTAGPPHLSFSDRGITFATNGKQGLCLRLREPVPGIDPTGRIRHPGVTLTVGQPRELMAALGIETDG